MPALEDNLVEVVSDHAAGDPMREDVLWTYLSSTEIAEQLAERGTPVGADTVRRLLAELGFVRRQADKTKALADAHKRDQQFEIIARWRRRFELSAHSMLLLCGGGSNNWRHMIFKEDLQRLVHQIGPPIQVAHYPPHCSKYNPIEHRLFPHVTRAWSEVDASMAATLVCLRYSF